mmetsp:Transcript_54602/g.137874  ORF Transcript_54602/g.137874 Transcript_54602/m.137874 type:complete len:218 (+) Transcript_54602:794-1447(+)
MSFSASDTSSSNRCALTPARPASAAARFRSALKAAESWKTARMAAMTTAIGTQAIHGLAANISKCCSEPPALMAAKPAMCARRVAQHRILRMRFSFSTGLRCTATSILPNINVTLFWPFGFLTSFSFTTLPYSANIESAMTHSFSSKSTASYSNIAPESHPICTCKQIKYTKQWAKVMAQRVSSLTSSNLIRTHSLMPWKSRTAVKIEIVELMIFQV